jgi:hypothetical protein
VWFAIFNFLSIHSKCFKGNENEENFWFDDPSNASTEEAVPAEIQDEKFRENVRRTMEEKERSQGDTRRPEEDTANSVEDTGRVIQRKYRKIPGSFVRMVDILKTKIRCVVCVFQLLINSFKVFQRKRE